MSREAVYGQVGAESVVVQELTAVARVYPWSAARASDAVRAHESQLRAMVGPDLSCRGL